MTNQFPDKHVLYLWQMVVEQIRSESTRAIVKHCKIIEFDPVKLVLAVKVTPSMFDMFCLKLSEIEDAFELVYRSRVKLEIQNDRAIPKAKLKTNELDILALEKQLHDLRKDSTSITVTEENLCLLESQESSNNQGLGATHRWNNLNFRSQSEIKIAEVLDARGILFFPNVRGRVPNGYKRINMEIDFLICHEGRWGILECDGAQFHQIAADDHSRDMVWNRHGIWFIKRFSSKECYNEPIKVVEIFLDLMRRFYEQSNKKP